MKKEDLEEIQEDFFTKRLKEKKNIKNWRFRERAQKAIKALNKNGFMTMYVENRGKAREEMLKLIPEKASVGAGGSMTIREIGILEDLAGRGHTMYDHWQPGLSQEEILKIRHAHLSCDVFLTSANALTLEGELVSTDAVGNRVCAMTFGPKKVIIAVGANKIVRDLNEAFRRIKELAAPMTLKGISPDLPCVQTGICADCASPMRGCRATLILERKPLLTDITVLVIGEEAGF